MEAAQDAAQITGIQCELLADGGRRSLVLVVKLVQHPDFREGVWRVQELTVKDSDLSRVKPIEIADRGDLSPRLVGCVGSGSRRNGRGPAGFSARSAHFG